jgi:hypothetical protein
MNKKNKDTIGCIVISVLVILAITFGGAWERGYFWIASEPLAAILLIAWIVERRKNYE